jgi:hypothetical protein
MIRADVSGAPPLLGSTGSTTIVLASLLVVIGIAMICTAVWLVRATRSDSRSLGPLEVMGDRSWRRRDAAARSRTLDAARPDDAPPPAPILARDPDDPPPMTTAPAAEETFEPELAPEPEPEPVDAVDETTPVTTDDEGGPDESRVDEPQPAEHS